MHSIQSQFDANASPAGPGQQDHFERETGSSFWAQTFLDRISKRIYIAAQPVKLISRVASSGVPSPFNRLSKISNIDPPSSIQPTPNENTLQTLIMPTPFSRATLLDPGLCPSSPYDILHHWRCCRGRFSWSCLHHHTTSTLCRRSIWIILLVHRTPHRRHHIILRSLRILHQTKPYKQSC